MSIALRRVATVVLALTLWSGHEAAAGGRVPYGGELRVSLTAGEAAYWRESLTSCQLFRHQRLREDTPAPELARDLGRWIEGRLRLQLVPGATFHDGTAIVAQRVVDSLNAARRGSTSIGALLGLLRLRVEDPLTLSVEPPEGITPDALRRLLAHPESGISHEQSGCGAFAPGPRGGGGERFEAHLGHPEGRPWLDAVTLVAAETQDGAVEALVFGDVDVSTTPSPRNRRVAAEVGRGWATVFALPASHWRGAAGVSFRSRVSYLLRTGRFGAHLDSAALSADAFLPPDYTLGAVSPPAPPPSLMLETLTVAYPAQREDLAELARAVRDRLRGEVSGTARVVAVEGLEQRAASERSGGWDLALVAHEWKARDAGQAALEASHHLGVPTISPVNALKGALTAWFRARASSAEVIPVVHLARPAFVRPGWHLQEGAGYAGGVAWSWRQP